MGHYTEVLSNTEMPVEQIDLVISYRHPSEYVVPNTSFAEKLRRYDEPSSK